MEIQIEKMLESILEKLAEIEVNISNQNEWLEAISERISKIPIESSSDG